MPVIRPQLLTVFGKGPASKALAKALGVRRNRKAQYVIRWRKTEPLPAHWSVRKEFNSANAIRKASDKLKTLQVLKQAGVAVPPFAERLEDLDIKAGDIILGRTRYHSKGIDMVAMKKETNPKYFHVISGEPVAKEQFLTKEYFVKWLKSRSEYRYHVAFGKVILCTKKVLDNPDSGVVYFARNHQGGAWKQVVCAETPRFAEVCVKAVAALGLDFGAVDFLMVNREAVVLEVNTAPGLEVDNRLTAYTNAFKEAVNEY